MSLAAPAGQPQGRIRVMVVDDSAVVRGLTRRWLEVDARIELVRVSSDGAQAIEDAKTCNPDIILLDVEMPKMDGLAALPQLRSVAPRARIIMASSLTSKGASTTIRALSLGAADYIAKPEATSLGSAEAYRRELVEKIIALAPRSRTADALVRQAPDAKFALRPPPQRSAGKPQALVVASSTGGPQALQNFLGPIAKHIDAPILIVQHMPATFTAIFSEKLGQAVGKPCREPVDGDVLGPGSFFLAPGDWHMKIARHGGANVIRLDQTPPVNYCRPAADPMFESAAAVFGARLVAVVLTGMGADGRGGAGHVVKNGGRVVVQDEASSVVWGMPGAVAMAGYAEAVEPLPELSRRTLRMMNGEIA
ncbi:MAG: chemotaxis response regulator protein-glutamate methylesterase [Hyphomonadaceae bacterium]